MRSPPFFIFVFLAPVYFVRQLSKLVDIQNGLLANGAHVESGETRRFERVPEITCFLSFSSGGTLTRRASTSARVQAAHVQIEVSALDRVEPGVEDDDEVEDDAGVCVC